MLDVVSDRDRSTAAQGVLDLARQKAVRSVDLKFADLGGRWHHLTLPVERLELGLFQDGVAFDGSSVAGFARQATSDMTLLPDPQTAFLDPFWEHPVLSLVCDIHEGDGTPCRRDPRGIARRAEKLLRDSGIADIALMGPEFEFYVFDRVRSRCETNRCEYTIDTSEGEWNAAHPEARGTHLPLHGGYHALPPRDQLADLREEMVGLLQAAGVAVKYHHHEGGGAGQCEIEIVSLPLLRAADVVLMVKYFVRMAADRRGRTATFMPKPLWGAAGNGMHVHQHLFRREQPLFWDARGWAGLSTTALHYVGGLLQHAPALLGLTNPSTNSYARLVPGFEAPVHPIYGLANRSAAVRVPAAGRTAATKRIEFRPPDATCNSYLAFAAMLLAGIDGIERRIDPSAAGFGPYDQSLDALPERDRPPLGTLPLGLGEALDALQRDHDFLLAGGVFDSDVLETWIALKRRELHDVRTRPHPREIALYLDA